MVSLIEFLLGKLFIYFILAIITCALVEMILVATSARSRILGEWLQRIFDKQVKPVEGSRQSLGEAIMNHSAITALSPKGRNPAYINPKNFSNALLEQITYNADTPNEVGASLDNIIDALNKTTILSLDLKRTFLQYAYEVKENHKGNDLKNFKQQLELWFQTSMDSLTGSFKIHFVRPWTFLVATLLVILMNVDSIAFIQSLYHNTTDSSIPVKPASAVPVYSAVLDSLNSLTPDFSKDSAIINHIKSNMYTDIQIAYRDSLQNQSIKNADFLIGWQNFNWTFQTRLIAFNILLQKIIGLSATVLIITLLAPFLFELGNKYSNIRGSGPKPGEANEK